MYISNDYAVRRAFNKWMKSNARYARDGEKPLTWQELYDAVDLPSVGHVSIGQFKKWVMTGRMQKPRLVLKERSDD